MRYLNDLQEQINQLIETFIKETKITMSVKFLDRGGRAIKQLGVPVVDDPAINEYYIYAEIIKSIGAKLSDKPNSFKFESLPADKPVQVFGFTIFGDHCRSISRHYPTGRNLNKGDVFSVIWQHEFKAGWPRWLDETM